MKENLGLEVRMWETGSKRQKGTMVEKEGHTKRSGVVLSFPLWGKHQALGDLKLCSSGSHSPSLIYRIKSGRFSCATPPSQARHQCCHLSLATQRHISKGGQQQPFQKIFAQIGPTGITTRGVSLWFFHWDNSNIPLGAVYWKMCHTEKIDKYESLCYV